MKTEKITVVLNLFGVLMVICSCIFAVVSTCEVIDAFNHSDEDILFRGLMFMIATICCLLLSFMSFVAEIYRSLIAVEKYIDNEQRKN